MSVLFIVRVIATFSTEKMESNLGGKLINSHMSDVHQLFFKKNLLGLTVTNKKFRRISNLFLKIKLIRGQTVFGSKEENVNIFLI